MEFPEKLKYSKEHEWLSGDNGTVSLGVTSFAVEQLGDIIHLELPDVGTSVSRGDTFGTIESTKTVSDVYLPTSGIIEEVNEDALAKPELVQEDPYRKGWLVRCALNQLHKILCHQMNTKLT